MRILALLVLCWAPSLSIAAGEPTAVRHEPVSPKPGVPVLVTARLAEGTSKPTLRLRAVAPGKYVRQCDAVKAPHPTFSSEVLGTLQALTLLARAEDVARSQWDGAAHKQKQQGTLVYRGVAYDHIQYSNRGQGSAYIAGKNKWGLKFNRG